MEIEETLKKLQKLQFLILNYLEESDDDTNFEELTKFIIESSIFKSKQNIYDLLRMIYFISINHRRESNFFTKIIQIILFLLPEIQKYFSYFDIYDIFCSNKLMILLLIQNEIIVPDEDLILNLTKKIPSEKMDNRYFLYFTIKQFFDEKEQKQIEEVISRNFENNFDIFQQNCQIGENESYICNLIREDSIDDFIIYVNKTNYPLNSNLESSVYETNDFLINKTVTLIEYAAFFGSIQIFKFLQLNNVKIEQSIFKFAIHGRNPDLIHSIEEFFFTQNNKNEFLSTEYLRDLLDESIYCHHNDIARYIKDRYLCNDELTIYIITCKKCYNYQFLPMNYRYFLSSFRSINKRKSFELDNIFNAFLIDEITVPSSDVKIGESTFSDCVSIKKITIPSSVESFGLSSFFNCESLKCIVFEGQSSLKSIENNAFSGCSSLVQFTIPPSVTSIGNSIFYGCSSLEYVDIPTSITSIGNRTFNGCSSLKQIKIPLSVESIGNNAFNGCSSLEEIIIPPSVKLIKNNTFNGCSSLKQIVIPQSVALIKNNAFEGCSSLKQIKIPSSVTLIESSSFFGCKSLELIEFESPSSLTSIGNNAFYECSSLTQIIIPASVKSIGNNAFYKCSSLVNVSIPTSITSIMNNTFNGCSLLKHIIIPPSVVSIGNNAFEDCSSLEKFSVPPSVKSIGSSSFLGCKSLKQITFESPSSVDSIGDNAFIGCSSLDQVTIPPSVTSMGNNVFDENSSNANLSEHISQPSNDQNKVGWGKTSTENRSKKFRWGTSTTTNRSNSGSIPWGQSNNNSNNKTAWGGSNNNSTKFWKGNNDKK